MKKNLIIITAFIWAVAYCAALFALKKLSLSPAVSVVVAVVPIIPFALFLREFIRHLQSADELERRVQLEALAIAFPTTLAGLMLLGLLQVAVPLDPREWSYRNLWTLLPPLYFSCVALRWKHYR